MSVYSPWHVEGLICRTRQLTNRRARLIAARSMSKGRERRRASENAPHHVSAGRRGRCDGDRHRAESPLQPASDAVILDSTAMTLDQVLAAAEEIVRSHLPA